MKFLEKFGMILLFLALTGVTGCGKKNQNSNVRPPIAVVSTVAKSDNVVLYVDAIGSCVASEAVNVVPQVGGEIVETKFSQGQAVKSGDPLFILDKRVYEANLKQSQAQLEAAKAKLKVDVAQLERSKALLPQNYISQQQYEMYEAQVEQDRATVEVASACLENAKLDLEHCTIISPIDGIAGEYLIDKGNIVVGNVKGGSPTGQPLVTIKNIDQLYVEFSISENSFFDLQKFFQNSGKNLSAEIYPISEGNTTCGQATISFLNNCIDPKTGSMKLRALLKNSDHKFWPGQSVRVRVALTVLPNSILLPIESVKLGQNGYYVFVIKDDKSVELRFVEIGQTHDDMLVIKRGVKAGEVVVQRGQLLLSPGAKVFEMPDSSMNVFQKNLEKNKQLSEKNPTTK